MSSTFSLGQPDVRIDLYPVVPHLRVYHLARRLRHNYIGLFHRHMTVNALARDLVSQLFRHTAALPLMTAKALQRIGLERLSGACGRHGRSNNSYAPMIDSIYCAQANPLDFHEHPDVPGRDSEVA